MTQTPRHLFVEDVSLAHQVTPHGQDDTIAVEERTALYFQCMYCMYSMYVCTVYTEYGHILVPLSTYRLRGDSRRTIQSSTATGRHVVMIYLDSQRFIPRASANLSLYFPHSQR